MKAVPKPATSNGRLPRSLRSMWGLCWKPKPDFQRPAGFWVSSVPQLCVGLGAVIGNRPGIQGFGEGEEKQLVSLLSALSAQAQGDLCFTFHELKAQDPG